MKLIAQLKNKVKQLKKQIYILKIAYIDARTPFFAKLLIGLTVGYLLSPIDLIPDFIPILGVIDDLILVPILIFMSIKTIPTEVLIDAEKSIDLTQPELLEKNNWFIAFLIVSIWVSALILFFKQILF